MTLPKLPLNSVVSSFSIVEEYIQRWRENTELETAVFGRVVQHTAKEHQVAAVESSENVVENVCGWPQND